jgi:tetratricopeptide (TPR) repeat protein
MAPSGEVTMRRRCHAGDERRKSCNLSVSFVLLGALTLAHPAAAGQFSQAEADRYVNRGDWNGSLAYTRKWAEADPNDAMAWFYLGNTLLNGLHQPQQAIEPLRRAATLKPDWSHAWYDLGVAQQGAGQPRDAIASLERAKSLAPQRMLYWTRLATAYTEADRFMDARALLLDAEKTLGSKANYADWFNIGLVYHKLHEEVFAARAFKRSVDLNPSYSDGWNMLGIALENAGNDKGAQQAYERGASLGNQHAANNLGKLKGRIAAAALSAKQAPPGYSSPYDDDKARIWRQDHASEPEGQKSINPYSASGH